MSGGVDTKKARMLLAASAAQAKVAHDALRRDDLVAASAALRAALACAERTIDELARLVQS